MNPELPAPQASPEANREYRPPSQEEAGHLDSHETSGENSHEREQNMKSVDLEKAPPIVPVVAPLPAIPVPVPVPQKPQDDTTGPSIASDDDLIEKEWVDKAKKIIAATQNDPYRREQEVNKLQVDYLRKRYGKELGTSN
jgi:hypothetical protein